jgi:hypothetical protein
VASGFKILGVDMFNNSGNRPGCIKYGIILFEIYGAFNLVVALYKSFGLIFGDYGDRIVEILVTTIPVFFIIVAWINFFSPAFSLWKNRSPLIKAIALGVSLLPAAVFILPFALSTFFGEPEFDPYNQSIVSIRQFFAEAGVWIGAGINLRRSFPKSETAEQPTQDSQNVLA